MSKMQYKTVLVTGAAGFVGSHLLQCLKKIENPPDHIVGLDLHGGSPQDGVDWEICDLENAKEVDARLEKWVPDGIIHLAGILRSESLQDLFRANVVGCANLLGASANLSKPPRILVIGTAAQYGILRGNNEIVDERRPLNPVTPYGISKTMQEQWALLYASLGKVPVCCVRLFNMMGPGQPSSLVPASFFKQIFSVLDGKKNQISVGNLETERDFTDVRDVVKALCHLLHTSKEISGEVFNIASYRCVRIRDILRTCIELSNLDIPIHQNPTHLKKYDVLSIVGNSDKLTRTIQWEPTIPWRKSLEDMWRERLSNG